MTPLPPVRTWLPWLVLLSGLSVTAASAVYVGLTARSQARVRFGAAVQDVTSALNVRLENDVALLRAGSALFATSGSVSRQEFQRFAEQLELHERFRGVQGVGFSRRVRVNERRRLESEMRRLGLPDFRVWPATPTEGLLDTIVFIEPLDVRNRRALGYNMFSEEVRRTAMLTAARQARPVASGRVTLVQEGHDKLQQAGFLVFMPVYRGGSIPDDPAARVSTLQGFVYSPFRVGDLVDSVLDAEQRARLVVQIYDGSATSEGSLLFDSTRGVVTPTIADLTRIEPLDIQGRRWTMVIAAQPSFGRGNRLAVPMLLAIGSVVSIALFVLTRAEARARAFAEESAAELRRSEEELQAASRAKDEFLATLSHELRTPLNAILGWTRMLRMGHLDESRGVAALQVIERNARALARLVEDLLDMSRVVTGKLRLDLRSVALNPIVEEALATVRPAAEAKGIAVVWTPDPDVGWIVAAPDRLHQVFWNLLSNAIKFTPAGGRVEVATSRGPGEVVVTVRDTGRGISAEFLPHVFERFRQADSTSTRSHAGVGLGLAIVRHLVELHGGAISVASEGLDKGTLFTARFPVRGVAPPEPPSRTAVVASGPTDRRLSLAGLRVLVVDDEEDARVLVEHALEGESAHVHTAASAAAALEHLREHEADVVISDLAMPGEDGYTLLRRVRASDQARVRTLPVVALTAYARADDRSRALAAGFQAFISKPVDIDELISAIAHVSGRSVAGQRIHT
jgi:signal transduction histidine kinase/ActR/RegA family two-component response regulator